MLNSIDLYDVGPFTSLRAGLDGRMVGVTGPNGSGKSTLLRSIAFAFTGDTNCLGRRDAVRIGRTAADQPYVVLNFTTHDGKPASIARWLPVDKKNGRHKLSVDERSVSTADEIGRWVEAEFGLSLAAAREVLFVEQGCLTDIVSAPAAKRAGSFQKAFGLESAARAHSAAIEHLAALPAPPDDGSVAAARDRVAGLVAQAAACAAELFDTPVPDPDEVDRCRAVLSDHERRRGLEPVVDRIRVDIRAADTRLSRPPAPTADRAEVERLNDLLAAVDDFETWTATVRDHRLLVTELRRRESELATLVDRDQDPPPEPPARLRDLRSRSSVIDYVASMPELTGSECPVCAQPYTPSRSARDTARAELDELNRLENEFSRAVRDRERREAADREHRAELVTVRGRIATATAVASRPPPPDPNVSRVDVLDRQRDWLVRSRAHATDVAERAAAENTAATRRTDLAAVESQMPPPVPPALVETSRGFLREADAVLDRRRSLEARETVVAAALTAARRELDSAEQRRSAADTVRDHRTVVSELVTVLHRDAAPAAAAAAALATLTRSVNDRLEQVGADYRVSVAPDGEIVCSFGDGSPARRAHILSPGQQMTLAIAWRVSIVDHYCPRAGVLCLDEPTTGLDETRIAALRSALDGWRAAGSGPQFVVVTHDHRLCGAFDRVIEL